MMPIDPAAYRDIFFQEAAEHIVALEGALLHLENAPNDIESLNEAFRASHSIKGGADAVGFSPVANFTHVVENLLDELRQSGGPVPSNLVDLLLQAADMIEGLISSARSGEPTPPGVEEMKQQLARATAPASPPLYPASHQSEPQRPAELRTFKVTIAPHPESFHYGLDPMLLLRDLMRTGTVARIDLKSELPPLADLDPERCFLLWEVFVRTDKPVNAIEDVFLFAEENVRFSIEPVADGVKPQVAPPPVHKAPAASPVAVAPPVVTAPPPKPVAAPVVEAPKAASPEPVATELPSVQSVQPVGQAPNRRTVPDSIKFGLFLVERGVISAEKVLISLDQGRSSRPLLGALAVHTQKMTVEQIFATLGAMTAGKRFGETAVQLGYLSLADLGILLMLQERTTPTLGLCLIQAGFMSEADVELRTREFVEFVARGSRPGEALAEVAPLLPELVAPSGTFLAENAEMLGEFCAEAGEHLDLSDKFLLTLDADPGNQDAINAIYRAYHTIKGVAGMLNLDAIRTLAHEAENLLNLAREGKIVMRGLAMDLAFVSTDALKRQIDYLRAWLSDRRELKTDPTLPQILESLRKATTHELVAGPISMVRMRHSAPGVSLAKDKRPQEPKPTGGGPKAMTQPPVSLNPQKPSLVADKSAKEPEQRPAAEGQRSLSRKESRILAKQQSRADKAHEKAAEQGEKPPEKADKPAAPRAGGEKDTVRVDRERLDKLINTIGELVIAQSMAQQEFDELTLSTGGHSRSLPELSKISRDLQELSLSLRMIPLQGTFQKMARLVRDLSRKLNKAIDLELHGDETELDKTVVDRLGDPLMHMVRNAVDHGLESSSEERLAAGKSASGKVSLRAYYQGGNVFIELTDDGRGMNKDIILKKAIEKGLVSESQRLTDAEIYALIFAPGFSTAKAVTDVSGRGVGMDVVRRNVEALQGSIHIRTKLGSGTTFTIRLPLTLAIMDGLMVGCNGDVYVLPLLSVIESFRPRRSDVHVIAGKGEVVVVRGEPVPLLRLNHLLGRPSTHDLAQGLLVLVEDQGKKMALLVDELLGQMQAVVKSLDSNFRRVEGIAGATILGDGRVAMILDVHGLSDLRTTAGAYLASMVEMPHGELLNGVMQEPLLAGEAS